MTHMKLSPPACFQGRDHNLSVFTASQVAIYKLHFCSKIDTNFPVFVTCKNTIWTEDLEHCSMLLLY